MNEKRRRLVNDDYTCVHDGHENGDGFSIMRRWQQICRDFVEGLPPDIELTDVMYLCGGSLYSEICRRIIRTRGVFFQ